MFESAPEGADGFAQRGFRDETPKEADAPPAVMLDCGYRSSVRGSLVVTDALDPVTPQLSSDHLRLNLHNYPPVIDLH